MASPDPEVQFRGANLNDEYGQGDITLDDDRDVYVDTTEQDGAPELMSSPNENSQNRGSGDHRYHAINSADGMGVRPRFSIKPDPYNGKDDWEEYISHFENCAELGRWGEKDKVLALSASLRGPARTFYITLTTDDKQSYRTLVNKLGHRFGSSRQQNRWLSRFESRKRQPDETIAELGDDLRQMAQKAYSNLDTQAQEALALNQLYKAISLEMKCRCIDRDCKSASEAVEIIERYEAILGDGRDNKKFGLRAVSEVNPPKGMQNYTQSRSSASDNADIERALKQVTNRLEKLEKVNGPNTAGPGRLDRGRRLCYQCSSTSHFVRDCPFRVNTGNHMRVSENKGNFVPSTQ